MNHESDVLLAIIIFLVVHGFIQSFRVTALRQSVRRLERTMGAVIKHQGIEWPSGLSPEVRLMAQEGEKIAAIKLHREQHPDLGLAEAKKDVEDCLLGK